MMRIYAIKIKHWLIHVVVIGVLPHFALIADDLPLSTRPTMLALDEDVVITEERTYDDLLVLRSVNVDLGVLPPTTRSWLNCPAKIVRVETWTSNRLTRPVAA